VAEWNKENDRGQKVLVRPEGKDEYEAMAVTQAYMCYGIAVVHLDNDFEVPIGWVRAMMPCCYCQHSLAEPFPFETFRGEAVCQDCGEERNFH
jgi:hypothetical protein